MTFHGIEHTRFLAAALLTVALPALAQQPSAQRPAPQQPGSQPVTVIGCLARNGDVEHDRGTRQLNTDAKGFALTEARITSAGTGRTSAVPGSSPNGQDTGTIPRNDIVAGRQAASNTTNAAGFALSGKNVEKLADLVGQRIEVVGTLAPDGASEKATEPTAHPSADLRRLEVISFRGVAGACQ